LGVKIGQTTLTSAITHSCGRNRDVTAPPKAPEWPIRVVAVDPDPPTRPAFREEAMPGFATASRNALLAATAAHGIDGRSISKPTYDAIRRWARRLARRPVGVREREVAGKSVQIVGLFPVGDGFLHQPTGNLPDERPATFPISLPDRDPLESVQIGLIRLEHGADVTAVRGGASVGSCRPTCASCPARPSRRRREAFWTHSTPGRF